MHAQRADLGIHPKRGTGHSKDRIATTSSRVRATSTMV